MYIYIYIYIYTHTHTHTCVPIYTHLYMYRGTKKGTVTKREYYNFVLKFFRGGN